jgi:tRNA (cytidine56-2'-O)-methyltransferase
MAFSGEEDDGLVERVNKVTRDWGGKFAVWHEPKWENYVKGWQKKGGVVIHCTMYGERIQDIISSLKKESHDKDVLIVVGGEKVPGQMYRLADYNVAITSQPHSEIAALAILLDRLLEGRELDVEYEGARLKVVPQKRGKKLFAARRSI